MWDCKKWVDSSTGCSCRVIWGSTSSFAEVQIPTDHPWFGLSRVPGEEAQGRGYFGEEWWFGVECPSLIGEENVRLQCMLLAARVEIAQSILSQEILALAKDENASTVDYSNPEIWKNCTMTYFPCL